MSKGKQYIGLRFGRLIATSEAEPKIRKDRGTKIRRFACICDCGSEVVVAAPDLNSGNTLSCGCWKIEATKLSNTTHGMSISVARGGRATTEYQIWNGMIGRCEQPTHISYYLYGKRGIKVCERWRSNFMNFYSDMGPRPSRNHSIDRIDSDGDYTPENCRWATSKEQFANSRVSEEFKRYMGRTAALRADDGID